MRRAAQPGRAAAGWAARRPGAPASLGSAVLCW